MRGTILLATVTLTSFVHAHRPHAAGLQPDLRTITSQSAFNFSLGTPGINSSTITVPSFNDAGLNLLSAQISISINPTLNGFLSSGGAATGVILSKTYNNINFDLSRLNAGTLSASPYYPLTCVSSPSCANFSISKSIYENPISLTASSQSLFTQPGIAGGSATISGISTVRNAAGSFSGNLSLSGQTLVTFTYDAKSASQYSVDALTLARSTLSPGTNLPHSEADVVRLANDIIINMRNSSPANALNENLKGSEYFLRGLTGSLILTDLSSFGSTGDTLNDIANVLTPWSAPIYVGIKAALGGAPSFLATTQNIISSASPQDIVNAQDGWQLGYQVGAGLLTLDQALSQHFDGRPINPPPPATGIVTPIVAPLTIPNTDGLDVHTSFFDVTVQDGVPITFDPPRARSHLITYWIQDFIQSSEAAMAMPAA